jgi:transposase InsO family protein
VQRVHLLPPAGAPRGGAVVVRTGEAPGKVAAPDGAAPHAGEGSAVLREPAAQLAELIGDPERAAEIGQRMRIVRRMAGGESARDALAREGIEPSANAERAAQRVYRRWRETGTVFDGRWTRTVAPTVMTAAVQAVVLKAYNARPGAGLRVVWRLAREYLEAERAAAAARGEAFTATAPSYESVVRFVALLPAAVRTVRNGGLGVWDQQRKLVVRFDPTSAANEVWQLDHTPLDVWVAVEGAPAVWEVRPAYLTVALDVHSRAVMAWVVSLQHPDAWTSALLLRQGILPKAGSPLFGVPATVVPDHGKDFLSHAVASLLGALGVRLDPCPPYYPNVKGKIERFFLTIKQRLAILPGAMANVGTSEGAARKQLDRLPRSRSFGMRSAPRSTPITRACTASSARRHSRVGSARCASRFRRTRRTSTSCSCRAPAGV